MTDDFTPWLRARLDAREASARAAAAEYPGDSGLHWEARNGSVTPTNPVDSNPVADAAGWGSLGDATAEHIADNDPQQTLALVAAMRAVLAEHAAEWQAVEWPHDQNGKGDAQVCRRCQNAEHTEWNPAPGEAGVLPDGFVAPYVLAPCPTVRALAAAFSAEPGYRPEWSTQ